MKRYIIPFFIMLSVMTHWQTSVADMDADRILDSAIDGAVDAAFSETERQLINQYYANRPSGYTREYQGGGKHNKDKKGKGGKGKGMPPGLVKKKQLPPGLQKQLERNGTLPPGLAKRDLPDDLEARLPPAKPGTERIIVDAHVMLVDKASGIIKDIIKDIVR